MRKVLQWTLFLILFFVIGSCSDDDAASGSNMTVRFENVGDVLLSESSAEVVAIPVMVHEPPVAPIYITYSVTTNANEEIAKFVSPERGQLTIPAGETRGLILIKAIDNSTFNNPSNTMTLELTSASTGYKIGYDVFEGYTKKTITFQDDDCPPFSNVAADFIGEYTANEAGYCNGCYTVTVTAGSNPNEFIFENLYDVGGKSTLTFDGSDPDNPKILFKDGEYLYTSSANGDGYIYNPSALGGENKSTFNTCSYYMDLYFHVCFSAGCTGEARVQLTKL